jgi:hypothetical protein
MDALAELTPEYVQAHWGEVAERARAGECVRVPAAGVAIVPIEQEEEALRAWGRRELARILDASRTSDATLSDDEAMALAVEEVRAVRGRLSRVRRSAPLVAGCGR